MMVLTKEAIDNDRSLKIQLAISSESKKNISSKKVWTNNCFFNDTKLELNLEEKIFQKIVCFILIIRTF